MAARTAEKERCGVVCGQRDKAAHKHRQVGEEMEALRLLLEAKSQAWMVAASALEVAQQEVDAWATRLRREQEQVSAAAMQDSD